MEDRVNSSLRMILIVVAVATLVRLGVNLTFHKEFTDDAFIFMRYVDNAASGKGLTYNPGTMVMGFSSALYALLLSGLKIVLPFLSTHALITGLNYLCSAAALFLFLRLAWDSKFRWVLAIPLTLYYPFIEGSLNGMETSLTLALIAGSLVALQRDKWMLGITLAAFVALARPEGFLFVLAVLAFAYVVKRKARWFDVLPGLALGAIWALTATHYYGSPLPQSMLSKSALYAGEAWGGMKSSIAETYVLLSLGLPQSLVEGSKLRLLALLAVSLVLLWPFAVGVWRGYKEKSYPFVTGVFFALFVASYAVGKPVGITAWHAVPPAVLFLVTVCAGLGHTVRGRNTVLAIGGVAAAVCAASIVFGIARRQVKSDLYTANYMQLGQELRSRYPSGSAVMIGDIGIVGYVTGWKVIDTAGLVSPEVLEPRPDGRRPSLCALILDKRPDAICLKSDILHEGTTNESWIDYRTYDSAAERAAFLGEYERIEDLSPLYGSVYVKRELVAPH